MKRSLAFAAALAAALALNGCTLTLDMTGENGGREYHTSRPDPGLREDSSYSPVEPISPQIRPENTDNDEIILPEDSELNVLMGDDYESLLADCNSLYTDLGGKLNIEVSDSKTLYDTLSKGKISGKPIDVSTFDNGMLFPYLAVENTIEPIDAKNRLPELSSDLWRVADLFAINNYHYVLPLRYECAYRLFYDTGVLKEYGIDDPADIPDKEWTVEKLCELANVYHSNGGSIPLAGNYGEPMKLSAGDPLVIYERDPAGFHNNLFDPHQADMTEQLFLLKDAGMTLDRKYDKLSDAFREKALFCSASLFDAQKEELPETVKTMPVPTMNGLDRYSEIKVYGLTLFTDSKHKEAAQGYFECAVKKSRTSPQGRFSPDFTLHMLSRTVYPYDKGISPGVSYSPAHMNEDHSLCVSELIYTEIYDRDDWGGVCAYYSNLVHNDTTVLNNKINKNIFGDS